MHWVIYKWVKIQFRWTWTASFQRRMEKCLEGLRNDPYTIYCIWMVSLFIVACLKNMWQIWGRYCNICRNVPSNVTVLSVILKGGRDLFLPHSNVCWKLPDGPCRYFGCLHLHRTNLMGYSGIFINFINFINCTSLPSLLSSLSWAEAALCTP